MTSRTQCPFVARACVGTECMGWVEDDCFVRTYAKLVPAAALWSAAVIESQGVVGAKKEAETAASITSATSIAAPAVQMPAPVLPPVFVSRPLVAAEGIRCGVDFGTAQSKVTVMRGGGEFLPIAHEVTAVIPSIVVLAPDGRLYFGEAAQSAFSDARRRGKDAEFADFSNLKLRLVRETAKRWSAVRSAGALSLHWKDALTLFLAHLIARAQRALRTIGIDGEPPLRLTLPVDFDALEGRKDLDLSFKFAHHMAEHVGESDLPAKHVLELLEQAKEIDRNGRLSESDLVLGYLPEPIAAVLGSGISLDDDAPFLLSIDSGHGTTDISCVRARHEAIEIAADQRIDWGGHDIDEAIRSIAKMRRLDDPDPLTIKRALLTDRAASPIGEEELLRHPSVQRGLGQLAQAIQSCVEKARRAVSRAPRVVLSGGNSLLPFVQNEIRAAVAKYPAFDAITMVRAPARLVTTFNDLGVDDQQFVWTCMSIGAASSELRAFRRAVPAPEPLYNMGRYEPDDD